MAPEDDPAHVAPFEPGEVVVGRYTILEALGAGGMGVVYKVEDAQEPGLPLALKAMRVDLTPPQAQAVRAQFKVEADALKRVRSRNVVHLHDTQLSDAGPAFIVMELLLGTDLYQHLRAHGPIPPAITVSLLRMLAAGLNAIHGAGFVHRDLKPENIFLERREDGLTDLKILDFGIVKDLAGRRTTAIKGTRGYMPPEQYGGELDERADVFALGHVAHDMLFGLAPESQPLEARDTAVDIEHIFMPWFAIATAQDKDLRFKTPQQAVDALSAKLGLAEPAHSISIPPAVSSASRRPVAGPQPSKPAWSRGLKAGTWLAIALLVGGGAALAWSKQRGSPADEGTAVAATHSEVTAAVAAPAATPETPVKASALAVSNEPPRVEAPRLEPARLEARKPPARSARAADSVAPPTTTPASVSANGATTRTPPSFIYK